MSTNDTYLNGVLRERADDTTRTVTTYSAADAITGTRAYTADENTAASATAAGVQGTICWDADYVYVCVATNTWKRSALGSW